VSFLRFFLIQDVYIDAKLVFKKNNLKVLI